MHYAKADPDDLLMSIQVTNAGPEADTLHVLPTAWFRNTWSWELNEPKPVLAASGERRSTSSTRSSATRTFGAALAGRDRTDTAVLRERDQPWPGSTACPSPPYPKDGINDHVVGGAATVNPDGPGHQVRVLVPGAPWPRERPSSYGCGCAPGRPRPGRTAARLGSDFDKVMAERRAEADEFYAELTPDGGSADEAMVMRQAFAGMLWSKQLYYYDVSRWLDGRPDAAATARRARARAATPGGATSTPSTSCRCRTSGSIPGSPPGIWPFTAWPWRTWIRRSPSTS